MLKLNVESSMFTVGGQRKKFKSLEFWQESGLIL